jgi:hypothetical protein
VKIVYIVPRIARVYFRMIYIHTYMHEILRNIRQLELFFFEYKYTSGV